MTRTAPTPHSVGIPPKRDEPKERPIAKFEDGKIFIDDHGTYRKRDALQARVLRWSLSHHPESHAQRIKDIDLALAQHEGKA